MDVCLPTSVLLKSFTSPSFPCCLLSIQEAIYLFHISSFQAERMLQNICVLHVSLQTISTLKSLKWFKRAFIMPEKLEFHIKTFDLSVFLNRKHEYERDN